MYHHSMAFGTRTGYEEKTLSYPLLYIHINYSRINLVLNEAHDDDAPEVVIYIKIRGLLLMLNLFH
jgi:hypothetical protein